LLQLTSGGENRSPSVSPDGNWIVYSSVQNGKTYLLRMNIDGGEIERLTDQPCSWPEVSPDGTLIACIIRDNTLGTRMAVIPFRGGPFIRTFPIPPDDQGTRFLMRWTPDSKAINYKIPSGFWRQGINDDQPEVDKNFEDVTVRNFAWSADGKNFAYVTGSTTQEIIVMENVE
jgi:Tol biopolymer transport system component